MVRGGGGGGEGEIYTDVSYILLAAIIMTRNCFILFYLDIHVVI